MKKYLLSGLLILSTSFVVADGHGSAEKEVLKALDAYMDERNSRDFKTVIAMSSTYNRYNTIQYNTIQYNTLQYNTIQYNTIHLQCDKFNKYI